MSEKEHVPVYYRNRVSARMKVAVENLEWFCQITRQSCCVYRSLYGQEKIVMPDGRWATVPMVEYTLRKIADLIEPYAPVLRSGDLGSGVVCKMEYKPKFEKPCRLPK
jgi:hypothetical protein